MTLLKKMIVLPSQSFTVRENNVTVATGVVTKLLPAVDVPQKKLDKIEFDVFT